MSTDAHTGRFFFRLITLIITKLQRAVLLLRLGLAWPRGADGVIFSRI